ncbi:MAG: universal stress protein [Acidobacteria bacterium]|nr:MAG: universal stress protein [Acidobacteriota bacterium]REK04176.1 MAG: universal stress protein [Acidobacteriota bacterium]REK15338.1 MAG: universal stress protein [Acidobacteriota bacterium]REK46428.1 MAG: universal stress protein [Acidobacteriota bacterium]
MKILVATDGSDYSKAAVDRCAKLIKIGEPTTIRVISIVEPLAPVGVEPFGVSTTYYAEAEQEAEKNAEDVVKSAKERLENLLEGSGATIETEVAFSRTTKGAIIDDATEWGADLIVVGSHGYGFVKRMLIGSVSDAVVKYSPCSVLVVRKSDGE